MSHGLLALTILFYALNAHAEKCKVSARNPAEVGGENFVVTYGKGNANEILFLTNFIGKPEQRAAVRKLITDAPDYYDLLTGVVKIYTPDKEALNELGSTFMFVEGALQESRFNYIYINAPPELFNELETTVKMFAAIEYDFERKMGPKQLTMLQAYMAATVGLGVFLHQTEPKLFEGVEYLNLAAADPLNSYAEVSKAEAKYQELLEEFRPNRKTRASLIQAAERLRSGHYKGESDREIKEDILSHFNGEFTPRVSRWVDLALAERRGGNKESVTDAQAEEEKPKSRRERHREKEQAQEAIAPSPTPTPAPTPSPTPAPAPKTEMPKPILKAEGLLKKQGKGLVLTTHDQIKKVQTKFKNLCD